MTATPKLNLEVHQASVGMEALIGSLGSIPFAGLGIQVSGDCVTLGP